MTNEYKRLLTIKQEIEADVDMAESHTMYCLGLETAIKIIDKHLTTMRNTR